MKKKTLCIIQARTGSVRFPGKVLKKIKGTPLLKYQIYRVQLAKNINKIVIATTQKKKDDQIESLCKKMNIDCFRGSEKDVLRRYYECSLKYPEYSTVMRLTGDCPLIDYELIDYFIDFFNKKDCDYLSPSNNFGEETFPEGIAEIEVFTKETLKQANKKAKLASEREHVTLFIRNNPLFKKRTIIAKNKNLTKYRLTVDEPEDFEVVRFIIENSDIKDNYKKLIALLEKHPKISQKNIHITRNEGLLKSLKEDR